jgi:hypothetical protein
MTLQLWIRQSDKERLTAACKVNLSADVDDTLTGVLSDPGFLSKIGKMFVLGRKKLWVPKGFDAASKNFPFVYVKNSGAYKEGLILSTYSNLDVKYHLKTQDIGERTGIHVEQLFGGDAEMFVRSVFNTYYDSLIRKLDEKDNHFVLYS